MELKIKIALADDEVLIREGIKNLLKQEDNFEVLFDVSNGNELIFKLENGTNSPDIILMDINMPECNGVEATRYIHQKFPEIAIVALSSYTSETFMKKMIAIGAVCYIPKNSMPSEMIHKINKVYQNGFFYEDFMLDFIKKHSDFDKVASNDVITEREIEVLKLVCLQKSSSEIAQLLHISPRTVEGHRSNLISKTHSKTIVGLVVYAIQNNFFIPENT